jgi:hypothetical protein
MMSAGAAGGCGVHAFSGRSKSCYRICAVSVHYFHECSQKIWIELFKNMITLMHDLYTQ